MPCWAGQSIRPIWIELRANKWGSSWTNCHGSQVSKYDRWTPSQRCFAISKSIFRYQCMQLADWWGMTAKNMYIQPNVMWHIFSHFIYRSNACKLQSSTDSSVVNSMVCGSPKAQEPILLPVQVHQRYFWELCNICCWYLRGLSFKEWFYEDVDSQ